MRTCLLLLVALLVGGPWGVASAQERQQRLLLTDFGAVPNSRRDVSQAFRRALEACGGRDAEIVFPKGRYDFWQDFSEKESVAMHLDSCQHITIDGQGSELVFHGRMRVLHIDHSHDIVARNFSTDWDRPYITQAQFEAIGPNYVDMRIDKAQYPYEIRDQRAIFTGEGWSSPVLDNYQNLWNAEDSCISYRTRDCYTGNIFAGRAEELEPGLVRFYGQLQERPIAVRPGQIITWMHGTYILTGTEIAHSKDIVLEDLTFYHTLSNGVYAWCTDNITLRRVSTRARADKGRVFSTVADASHFTNCRGHILIEECAHTGQMDDFVNVRGAYVRIDSVLNDHQLLVNNKAWTLNVGDTLWTVGYDMAMRLDEVVIEGIERRGEQYILSLADCLPMELVDGFYLENKSWTPRLTVRRCRFEKKNRARGLLVTTPRQVIIEDNYFNTAGAAILIEGDLDHWFESGGHTQCVIRNNVFENCSSSGCETGDRWEWGEAPITISPSYRPKDAKEKYTYHRGITITGNTFRCFDAPVLFARSVDSLRFEGNTLEPTQAFAPFLWQKSNIWLDGCRHTSVRNNVVAPNFPAQTIETAHMKKGDLEVSPANQFRIIRK